MESYLRQHRRAYTKPAGINLLRRAVTYINEKLESTCCGEGTTVVDLHTGREDYFTRSVYTILLATPLNGNRKSLVRARNLIENFIFSTCCALGIVFTIDGPVDEQIADEEGIYTDSLNIGYAITVDPENIQQVEYFVNGVSVGISTTGPTFLLPDVEFDLDGEETLEFEYYGVVLLNNGVTSTTNTGTVIVNAPEEEEEP